MDSSANDEDAVLPPIIFKSPGLKPDLYSAYFRKFLDSPEKPQVPPSAAFKYDYVSVVDDDGQWGLESTSMADLSGSKETVGLEGCMYIDDDQETGEAKSFGKLLCAMYNMPFKFQSCYEFEDMMRLADFYCALPVFSRHLDKACLNSPGFVYEISTRAGELIIAAKKLRNAALFRECFIHLAGIPYHLGPESCQGYPDDPEIRHIIVAERNRLRDLIMEANHEILKVTVGQAEAREIIRDIQLGDPVNALIVHSLSPMQTAFYYKAVMLKLLKFEETWGFAVIAALKKLLEVKLPLRMAIGKQYKWSESRFLSAEISDEDLPWDLEEVDW